MNAGCDWGFTISFSKRFCSILRLPEIRKCKNTLIGSGMVTMMMGFEVYLNIQ